MSSTTEGDTSPPLVVRECSGNPLTFLSGRVRSVNRLGQRREGGWVSAEGGREGLVMTLRFVTYPR